MRVISGKYKGRNLVGYTLDGTRPTQDRVKESIFSMIQEKIQDSIVLDLFAGSGNLGIESLSNGAITGYFVDRNGEACKVIKKNLAMLNVLNARVLQMDYEKALKYFKEQQIQFDLIFLDPPYKMIILDDILKFVIDNHLLRRGGLIVCEYEMEQTGDCYDDLKLLKYKKYGNKYVKIYEFETRI